MFLKTYLSLFLITTLSTSALLSQESLWHHDDIVAQRIQIEKDLEISKGALENLSPNSKLEEYELLNIYLDQTQNLADILVEENQVLKREVENNRRLLDSINTKLEINENQYSEILKLLYRKKLMSNDWAMLISSESLNEAWLKYRLIRQFQSYVQNEEKKLESLREEYTTTNQLLNQQLIDIKRNKATLELNLLQVREEKEKMASIVNKLKREKDKVADKIKQRDKFKNQSSQEISNNRISQFSINNPSEDSKIDDELDENALFLNRKRNLSWPVKNGFISEKFGKRAHDIVPNVVIENNGIGIMTQPGENVKAVHKGVVREIPRISDNGYMIIVEHGDYLTSYFSLASIFVSKGDNVYEGQILGSLSKSTTSPSILHFEIWKGYEKLNPEHWLKKR